jgi:hypothetical protein
MDSVVAGFSSVVHARCVAPGARRLGEKEDGVCKEIKSVLSIYKERYYAPQMEDAVLVK